MGGKTTLLFTVALVAGSTLEAQETVTAIRGGTLHTISHGTIEGGVIVFREGKILDVGRDVPVPSDARIIEAAGRIITPGVIDARTHFGVSPSDRWETSGPMVPQLGIIESFSPPPDPEWLHEGVTAVYVTPGPESVLGGMGAVVKLAGRREARVVNPAAGMSVSLGEVPKESFGQGAPRTRMGEIYLLRDALIRAREYLEARERVDSDVGRDLGMEALGRVLSGEVPLRVQANTPDDVMNAVRLSQEFRVRLVIDGGVGAHLVADKLAVAQVPVVVGPTMIGAGDGGRFEFYAHTPENAARLQRAGVAIALSTDDGGGRSVVLEAAVSRAHGLPDTEALKAITWNAAKILGVADRLGSLDPGKDADLVIWNGDPLGTWGEAETVVVDGEVVFER